MFKNTEKLIYDLNPAVNQKRAVDLLMDLGKKHNSITIKSYEVHSGLMLLDHIVAIAIDPNGFLFHKTFYSIDYRSKNYGKSLGS